MKKCGGYYDSAMNYDCQDCSEDCKFRKNPVGYFFINSCWVFTVFIALLVLAYFLI